MAILFTFWVIGMIFASSASAECGSPFNNKGQAVSFYKTHPGAANALKGWLKKHAVYEFNADQGLIQYLEQSSVRVFSAPRGYELTQNTSCPSGPEGGYTKYRGLYDNMSGKAMLWYCNKAGKCFPILKGYCRNAVMGPPVVKKPPKKHPPKKCKCKKHKPKKKKPKPTCEAQGMITVAGNCVVQSNNARQECEAKVNGTWNGNQCTIVQINANCSNVVAGENTNVEQGGNCNTIVTEPPCMCEPDHAPQISCVFPPHIFEGGSQFFWCEASDPDGDTISVTIEGDSHATVASTIPVNERWDKSPCPSGVSCYRSTLWGKTAGMAHIVAKVTANGKSSETKGEVEVVKDEF